MILELPTKKPGDPEALPIGAVIDLRREMPDGARAHLDRGWKVVGYTESGKGRWSGYELEAADGRRTQASKFEAFDQQQPETKCMQDNGENLFDGEADVDHDTAICARDGEWAKWTAWVLSRPESVRKLCAEFPMYTRLVVGGQLRWVIGYTEDGHVVVSDFCPRCYPLEVTRESAHQIAAADMRTIIARSLNS
jgi:hypothetical protein